MTLTLCKVWLGWKEKLFKFWEGQFGLQEGKVGRICAFSETSGNRGWKAKFAQFSRGTGKAVRRVSMQGLRNSQRELAVGFWGD